MNKNYFSTVFLSFLLLFPFLNYATTYYSRANTSWNTPSTWSTVSCGGAASATIPTASDDVIICVGNSVIINATANCQSLTIEGTANWTSAVTLNAGTGGVIIPSGGNITGTSSGVLTTAGGLTINSVLTSTTVRIRTITTPGQIITGTGTFARLDISTATVNNGNLIVTTDISSTVVSMLTQAVNSTLVYNGTSPIDADIDASASGNSITYGGTAQTIKPCTYNNLIISGSGIKTLGGDITVNSDLTVNTGTLSTSTFQITGNATGIFTLDNGTIFNIGSNGSATNVDFPTAYTTGNISLAATSTVVYYGNSAQTVSNVPNYGNLTIRTFSGSKTAAGNLSINGNLIVTSPSTLDMTSYTLNLAGNYTSTGRLSFTSGLFNIGGNYTNTGGFIKGTGTVNYNGSASQTVNGVNYHNLIFSNSGEKLLEASATVGISGDFTRGAMTVTPGTSNTVIFNGGVQVMTGTATTFNNLTVNNTSFTPPADFTVNTTLTTTAPALLDMGSNTLTVLGNYTGTGALSFTSGNFNISGHYSNTGIFTCGTSTVDYNGSLSQNVRGVNYYNLTFSNIGAKTLQASRTVGIANTFARGTMTVTPGTSNTVLFNGGVQTMTGGATTFTNLTLNNTSLTAPADFTINSTLTGTNPATLDMSSNTLSVTGNYTGSSALVFSSGNFVLSGNFTNTGIFTCGSGTMTYNGAGTQTVRGTTYKNLVFSNTGAKTLQAASTITITGDLTRGTMTVTPGATNTVVFNGGNQVITGNATTFRNLTINNTSLTIGADITVNNVLTFTTGTIITNAFNVLMGASGSIARTNGHVIGNLRKNVSTGSTISRTFEVGTGVDYTPLTIVFASVSTAGTLTAKSVAGDHPSIATSGFNAAATINRYWTLTNSLIVYTNYNVTATYVNSDKDAAYNTANSLIKLYNGSAWSLTNAGTPTSNSAQGVSVTIPTTPNQVAIQIGEIVGSATGNLYSIATGNWSTPGTWSQTSGGASCSCIPTSLDNVFIENNFIVTMNGNSGAAKSLTVQTGGKATWTAILTTYVGSGGVTIAPTGDITGTVAGTLVTSGGLTLNSALTSTTVVVRTANAPQAISGTGSLARLDISTNTTNNGNITVTTALLSTVPSTFIQGTGATLNYNGTTVVPTIDASLTGNTVTYGGTTQTIRSATYQNLTIAGSGVKTLGGAITVNGNLALNAGTLSTSTYQITGNASGLLTLASGTILNIGTNGATTNVFFPTNFITSNISLATTSTTNYFGNSSQTISHVPNYGNLTIQTFSGSKIASGNLTVAGNLVSTSPSTLLMASYTLNVAGSYTGTGALSFTSGNFNIGGTFTNTGAFTNSTGTVNYNGNVGQAIRGVNYYNLTFSGSGAKTLQASTTIGIAGNFNRGTMTVSTGATNTVLFNGGVQTMTGSALTLINLTINNTSLTIPAAITVNATLTFTSGVIITNANSVIMGTAGIVSRTNGHVIGNLRKYFAIGTNISKTFEVGTNVDYTPLTTVFASVTTAGNLTVSSISGDHPSIISSGFNPTYTINRYWTITNTSILYTNYSVTANFVNGDLDPGYNTANSQIKVYNGTTWSTPVAGVISSNSAQATALTIPITPNTVSIQIGDSNPSITGNLYSIANGNWSATGTWSQTSGGINCHCIPTSINEVIIENNFTVTMDGNGVTANSLTIQTGGKATWTSALTTNIGNGGVNVTSTGDITGTGLGVLTTSGGITLNKALTSSSITIKTINAPQLISGNGTLANLEIGVNTTNNGNIILTDVLTITAGTLSNSGTFTLKSDATKSARIAPVLCGSCGFSGNFIIQRYIPTRTVATWANLSSPVSNSTMADWDNELFLEYPFTGFDNVSNRPKGSNVMAYSEPSANYYQLTASTPLAVGKGFEIGLTNDNQLLGFAATTLTTIGTPNVGTVSIPLNYTAANGPAYPVGYSGQNLIGNPFASAISLSSILKTNALSSVDVYDYTIGNYRTLTGSAIIAPHQGFWAYAQGSGASFVIPESAKVTNSNTVLLRTNEEEPTYFSLTLSSADGSHTMAHTLEIACNERALDGFDNEDHPFRRSLNPKAPSLTAFAGNIPVSISTFNNNHQTYVMPLHIKTGVNGLYHIHTNGIKKVNKDFTLILLEDKITHTLVDLTNSMDYTFAAQTTDMEDRFVLHFSKSADYEPTVTAVLDLENETQIFKTNTGNIIHFNSPRSENMSISVVDIMGRNINYDIDAKANDKEIIITLPSDFHGWYVIVVQSSTNKTVKKFIQF